MNEWNPTQATTHTAQWKEFHSDSWLTPTRKTTWDDNCDSARAVTPPLGGSLSYVTLPDVTCHVVSMVAWLQ